MPEVMFAGPDGRLEGRYHHSKEPGAPLALILHPHPLHGGTMNNRITYTMYQSFQKLGFSVMRFNFRGVGRSQGRYDGGIGEISDAAAALDWMQMVNPNSGGLWICRLLVRRLRRHAAADAPAGDLRLGQRGAAGQPLRFRLPGALPVRRADAARRRRRAGAGAGGAQAGRQAEHAEERAGRLPRLRRRRPRVRHPCRRRSAWRSRTTSARSWPARRWRSPPTERLYTVSTPVRQAARGDAIARTRTAAVVSPRDADQPLPARSRRARLRLPMHRRRPSTPRCARARSPAISASTAPPTACMSAAWCRSCCCGCCSGTATGRSC